MRIACESGTENPRDVKYELAKELVDRFHGAGASGQAMRDFIARHRNREIPDEMPEHNFTAPEGGYPVANLLKDAGLVKSTSEAMRMIKQGAVRIDGERVTGHDLTMEVGSTHVYQVGKRRFARISVI